MSPFLGCLQADIPEPAESALRGSIPTWSPVGAALPAGAVSNPADASALLQTSSTVLFHRYRQQDWRVKKYWYGLGTSFLTEACCAYSVNPDTYQAELDYFKEKWRTPSGPCN